MEDIKLSPRLQMNVNMITKGSMVADIGCDHAYVAIWLYINKIAPKVIAMDVNDGPVKRAKENIAKYNLEDYIEVRKSDGTTMLREGEADALIIAGMGGLLTVKILSDNQHITDGCKELILSPQSDIAAVRNYLRTHNYAIEKEDMVIDEGKYYTSIKAINKAYKSENEVSCDNLTESILFDTYGEFLLKNKNDILKEMMLNQLRMLEEKYDMASQKGKDTLKDKISFIREGLKYYGM